VLVIIPAYDEGRAIAEVIGRVRQALPAAAILVVDDGSRDDTARSARSAGALVVSHPFNMGYGVAIQTGYKYGVAQGYDYLVQIDGDGQHDPAFIPTLLEPLATGETDFVIGSRFLEPGSYTPPLLRRLGMGFFRAIIRLVTGERVTDPTSGYQAFNAEVARFFATEVFPCDYPDADMLIMLHLAHFRIRELPVRMYANDQGVSMHRGLKPLYYVFKMLLSILVTLMRDHGSYRR
jgi:glycosyltransferase involved in cell wall biosynthesis